MITLALRSWFDSSDSHVAPVTVGNLNQTYLVTNAQGRFVLQRLNPIFSPEVNLDIDALAKHLRKHDVSTPRLLPTKDDKLWTIEEGHCFRLMTFVEGDNFNALPNVEVAKAAGTLVGRFHQATLDFQHRYHFTRGNPHDTSSHLKKLSDAVPRFRAHTRAEEVSALADKILSSSRSLADLSQLPKRHAHGDLKINNLIFGNSNSLIDLDTIGLMPWPVELGDAFRSWCNLLGENTEQSSFNETYFEAALGAYAAVIRERWNGEEIDHLIEGIRTIPLELSSRFLRDVLEDSYFGFDSTRFATRAEHNWVRAQGQWTLYCDIEKKRASLEQIIRKVFA